MEIFNNLKKELTIEFDKVLAGESNPLNLLIELKKILSYLDTDKSNSIFNEVLKLSISEFKKYNESNLIIDNCSISICQSGRYDYKDSKLWNQKQKELKEIEFAMQKAYKTGEIQNTSFGTVEPAIYSYSKESLKVNFK